MKSVKIDIAKTGIEIPAEMKAKTQEANALLHSGKGAGNDFLGWVHLPSSISDSELAAIEEVAAKLRAKADLVICIGRTYGSAGTIGAVAYKKHLKIYIPPFSMRQKK